MESTRLPAFARPRKQRLVRYIISLTLAFFIVTSFWDSLVSHSSVQIQHHSFSTSKQQSYAQPHRLKAVRREFLHSWYGYKDHAWMADSLLSLSGQGMEQFCSWSATLVDTLDTLWIMDLRDEFDNAVNATASIDFRTTAETCNINLFESTIRYLGGMLAAYDLSGDHRLYTKLVELGEILYGQFRTTNGMPCNQCKMITNHTEPITPNHNVPLADAGSFYLEFTRLSQITGDRKYADLVVFLTNVFETTQNSSSIPGLWPERVDAASINGPAAEFATKSHTYSLGALSDSAYEYLPKAHLLLGSITDRYGKMWHKAAQAIRSTLLFRAYIPQSNQTHALFSGLTTLYPESTTHDFESRIQHLGCFAGGMFALASRIFDDPADLQIGRELTEGCIWAYHNSPTGIMPETVTLLNCPDMLGPQCQWNQTIWKENLRNIDYPPGFLSSIDEKYLLRPEAIESIFVLYRITGEEYYRDVGWKMFENIIARTRTPYGHASLLSVMTPISTIVMEDGVPSVKATIAQLDSMESFWLAETLKYFWLLFEEPSKISLDEWVLNTEAHPLKLTKGIRAR